MIRMHLMRKLGWRHGVTGNLDLSTDVIREFGFHQHYFDSDDREQVQEKEER